MSTSPDLTISIPDESLDLIRDSMSYSFGRDWLPWAWAVLAQAGDVPAEFDLDSFDYHEQLLVLAGLETSTILSSK